MPLPTKVIRNISTDGYVTVNNNPIQLRLDTAAAADSIAVAANTEVIITDVLVSSTAAANVRLQQSNNAGVAWFDLLLFRLPADGMVAVTELRTPVRIVGGANVLFRCHTPNNATFSVSIRSYLETA